MRHFSTLLYQFRQGFLGVFRNGVMTVASMLVLISCMIVIGTFYTVVDTIKQNFNQIDGINIMTVILPDTLTPDEKNNIEAEVTRIGNEIGVLKDIKQYTKQENLDRFRERSTQDATFLEIINDKNNPIPSTIEVTFTNFSAEGFDINDIYLLKSRISEVPGVEASKVKDYINLVDNMSKIQNTMMIVGTWLMGILMLVSLFLITNTIKLGLHSRRNEISFMRYVGATKLFIRTPYMIEGVLIGLFSAGLALGAQYYIHQHILADIIGNMDGSFKFLFYDFVDYLPLTAAAFAGLGLFAGIVASSISINRYLKA